MHDRRICIFSLVMQKPFTNKMYFYCILHDLSISFPKSMGEISKNMQKNKKKIGRVATRKRKEIFEVLHNSLIGTAECFISYLFYMHNLCIFCSTRNMHNIFRVFLTCFLPLFWGNSSWFLPLKRQEVYKFSKMYA